MFARSEPFVIACQNYRFIWPVLINSFGEAENRYSDTTNPQTFEVVNYGIVMTVFFPPVKMITGGLCHILKSS